MGQILAASIGVLLLVAVASIVVGVRANERLTDRRTFLVDGIDAALNRALALENALVDQETGVRGYALTGQDAFLEPYRAGVRAERDAYRGFERLERGAEEFADEAARVRERADAWRDGFADEALRRVDAGEPVPGALVRRGRELFDGVRASAGELRADLETRRATAREGLFDAARGLRNVFVLVGVLIVVSVAAAGLLLHAIVTRPLGRLGAEARRVATGDFDAPLEPVRGPREVDQVGRDVEAMRARIVEELAAVRSARATVEAQAAELARSNADLEQFAYVASHDLQEPLRKVASFCQVLERRYKGQLDERADQYIHFIVDGAKRMQLLINDLLAFSRVGRKGAARETVDANDLVEQARAALSARLEEAGAVVEAGDLPAVDGERVLLVAVFQNLIGNGVKFRGDDPPRVRIEAHDAGDAWEFWCTDNGIGIDEEFAERIFVIFQRLHPRETYDGTGIGLALCRKIIEYHGGRIWLDTEHRGGTRFRFTLPKVKEAA
ncbi:sensor histidine kinase [Miltoncostaea marina]|uniref:sensor histidine kinase n=1 Tax=Miltoncostaea marina TaxID=2843215 RepID=UPI001C3E3793|nr:sensor histidine kinase [Miltoncostaea marina]